MKRLLLAVLAASPAMAHTAADLGWQAIAWPFPRDAWPPGLAYRCTSAACGGEAEAYIRPKPGFCANCALGVTDDAEVDAVSDLDLLANDFIPTAASTPITIATLPGRTRPYTLHLAGGTTRPAAGFALSRGCDLVVAVIQGPGASVGSARRLLEAVDVEGWVDGQLGGAGG